MNMFDYYGNRPSGLSQQTMGAGYSTPGASKEQYYGFLQQNPNIQESPLARQLSSESTDESRYRRQAGIQASDVLSGNLSPQQIYELRLKSPSFAQAESLKKRPNLAGNVDPRLARYYSGPQYQQPARPAERSQGFQNWQKAQDYYAGKFQLGSSTPFGSAQSRAARGFYQTPYAYQNV